MRTQTTLKSALFAKEGEQFEQIMLPHTWNAFDGQDGGNDYWRGIGTYKLALPNPTEGKKQYIEFQGANHVAAVYCNGREMGTHKGGFSTFRYDLTSAMKLEGNELTVVVTNAKSDIYPQVADFTFFGGLYRDVNFIETETMHFDLLKDGSDAVFVTPRTSGKTRIDVFPVNADGCNVTVYLKDADGNVVATETIVATEHTVFKIDVKEPVLWNGLKNPYCYTCEAVLEREGVVLDTVSVIYGYRGFHVDANTGFWLNEEQVALRGVACHQDRKDKGWAVSREDHDEDMEIIKELGANTLRLAHYQHDQYFYDLCDRNGLVLWAEIPFISQFIPSEEAYDNTVSQMREMIAQNYNHPSICFWGISNEITIGGESEKLYQNLCDLNALCKRMDSSRLTTMANTSMTPMDSEHAYITDVVSYNLYYGWYAGDIEDNGAWFDKFHKLNPNRCIGISEYGADNIVKWHSAEPENHDYTEEYGAFYHHEMLKIFETRPYIWASHVWNCFDFAADARDEGGVKGMNNKGLVTYDRKIKKDAFYIYKAYWSNEPMIHVAGGRFVDRAPEERNITVYTNCDKVSLMVDGVIVAEKEPKDHVIVFENVALKDGQNKIAAISGDITSNTITLNAVAEHNYAYDLPEGNQAANWFEDPVAIAERKALQYPKGYYSIKDKIGVLMGNPECAAVLSDFINTAVERITGGITEGENSAKEMMGVVYMMRLSDVLRMGGGVPVKVKIELNQALTKIKKEI